MSNQWAPRDFQEVAVKLMLQQSALGLIMDPGLGKTSTWLAAFKILKNMGFVESMIVVCPLLPMYDTWPSEIEKFDDFNEFTWCYLHGPDKDWHLENTKADIYLINPEGIKWLVSRKPMYRVADVLCVDECTMFKNTQTKTFKLLRDQFRKFPRRWIGSGTIIPNKIQDLFGVTFILDNGNALGKYITHFREKYMTAPPWNPHAWELLPGKKEEIAAAVANLYFYVSADEQLGDVLPQELVIDKTVKLPANVKAMLKELESEYMYQDEDSGQTIIADSEALVGIKARQICNGAVYKEKGHNTKEEYHTLHDAKLDALDLLLNEIGPSPTLIVYEFRHDKERIGRRHLDFPDISGMEGECLRHMIKEFNAGNIPRLMIQSSKARGLNIQGACNHMIWFGLTWNWEHYKQMLDRLRRQGNPHKLVFVYRLLADAKWEKDVANRLNEKRQTELGMKEGIRDGRTDGAYEGIGIKHSRGVFGECSAEQ